MGRRSRAHTARASNAAVAHSARILDQDGQNSHLRTARTLTSARPERPHRKPEKQVNHVGPACPCSKTQPMLHSHQERNRQMTTTHHSRMMEQSRIPSAARTAISRWKIHPRLNAKRSSCSSPRCCNERMMRRWRKRNHTEQDTIGPTATRRTCCGPSDDMWNVRELSNGKDTSRLKHGLRQKKTTRMIQTMVSHLAHRNHSIPVDLHRHWPRPPLNAPSHGQSIFILRNPMSTG